MKFDDPNTEAACQRAWGKVSRECGNVPQGTPFAEMFQMGFVFGCLHGAKKAEAIVLNHLGVADADDN